MAFQKWDKVHGVFQVNMVLNYYVLLWAPRKQGLRQGLSACFPLGAINQGAE